MNRSAVLGRTLKSLLAQNLLPIELIVIDASDDDTAKKSVLAFATRLRKSGCRLIWRRATMSGAARQRNEGVRVASQPVIWFFDDDTLFEPGCVRSLWSALQSDRSLGGVSAMIVNQRYQRPGHVSRLIFRLMAGGPESSYAGRVLGPAINLLPEDRDSLPAVVPVEWLNTTCTLYRRTALPDPPFPSHFTGYSLMEDLALSLTVGRHWKLANARTARIYHDSQPGAHKSDVVALSRMELVNRHYVMTKIMERHRVRDYAKLALWELFQLAICAVQKRCGFGFWQELRGKVPGLCDILSSCMKLGRR
jgi:glycosyltransferase involved in cell wall biosynthesis